jgi:hypothetical protein
MSHSLFRSLRFYIALGVGGLLLLQILFNLFPLNEKEIPELSKLQEKEMEIFLTMDQLLTTLATLTMGGVAAIIFQRYKNRPVPALQVRRAVVSWTFSGLSLVCGYLSYQNVGWMLHNNFLNLHKGLIRWPSFLQFSAFAISLLFLVRFVLRALEDKPKDEDRGAEETE